MEYVKAAREDVERVEAVLAAYAREAGVDSDMGSVIRELVVRPMAEIVAGAEASLWKAGAFSGLLEAADLPAGTVDNLASNLRVVRRSGDFATGMFRVYMPSSVAVTLPAGTVFTVSGLTATTANPITTYTGDSVPGDANRVFFAKMRRVSDSRWYFDVPVVMDVAGPASVSAGAVVSVNRAPRGMVECVVSSPVTGGGADEDNAALAARAMDSGEAAVPSGTTHIKAAVSGELDLGTGDIGVAGCGDAFLLRGRSPLTGVASGGAADIYVRASGLPSDRAVQVSMSASNGAWVAHIDPEDAAGVAEVVSVATDEWEASGSALSVSYGVAPGGSALRVDTPAQARLGTYQMIQIAATGPLPASGTVEGRVVLRGFQGISAVQDMFLPGGKLHSPFLDVAVKAAAPLFLSMSVKSGRALSDDERSALASSIGARVSALPVGSSRVDASLVVDAFAEVVPDTRPVFPVVMRASSGVDGFKWVSGMDCGFVQAPPDNELYHSASRVWCCGADNVKVTDG